MLQYKNVFEISKDNEILKNKILDLEKELANVIQQNIKLKEKLLLSEKENIELHEK